MWYMLHIYPEIHFLPARMDQGSDIGVGRGLGFLLPLDQVNWIQPDFHSESQQSGRQHGVLKYWHLQYFASISWSVSTYFQTWNFKKPAWHGFVNHEPVATVVPKESWALGFYGGDSAGGATHLGRCRVATDSNLEPTDSEGPWWPLVVVATWDCQHRGWVERWHEEVKFRCCYLLVMCYLLFPSFLSSWNHLELCKLRKLSMNFIWFYMLWFS